ncbi:C-GCAxxG-C-C family (seleno)protein [Negativibacillus massiliensis]|mgnify:FL=1|uniref:C-GCAxxG-C-C family (seleno)protein n=1 Tax=Negativibacillus massiliensis TaxID=1871035 RepID=UPI0003350169|nr:C-GCAxxG-C-C family (seleno)protein [Negativibacillus massiliensis]MBS5137006.1 C-GCAxxG-C-C family protein [Clostridium sp.]MDY4047644.1 C-GCAxxG-C-C family (seleno)protein [Negativibacillus massiliensis]CDA78158.1 c_GCAxxG_C_C family protein [Clostridium sp. CAG:242]
MRFDVDLERIRKIAEDYYRNGDFYCSEAVVKTIIDEFQIDVSEDVIKMASGFPVGMGGMGCTCGALTGGVMAIGLVYGRSQGKDPKVNKAMELSAKLYQIFCERHKVSCCKVLTRGMEKGSPEHMEQCIAFTGEMAYEAAKIIAENAE